MPDHENGGENDSNTTPSPPRPTTFDLNYINTNARSLRPKITSVIDAFANLDLTFAAVTETWFSDGDKLEKESDDLLLGHGIRSLVRNRPPGNAGYSHGGVALLFRDSLVSAKLIDFPNPDLFEVLPVLLTIKGVKRKFAIITVYIPPGYAVPRGRACLQHVNDLVLEIKNRNDSPYIGIFGDFNQWPIDQALADYPDLVENIGGPTRGDRTIDRNFCNWSNNIIETAVLPPLETEETEAGTVRRSDHKVVLTRARVRRLDCPKWRTFTHRPFTDKGAKNFKEWLARFDWSEVIAGHGSNEKVRRFQLVLDEGMDYFFPLKTVRQKSNDLPWFNETARKKLRKRKPFIVVKLGALDGKPLGTTLKNTLRVGGRNI